MSKSSLWTLKVYCISRINWFLACWHKFMQIKSRLKILGVGLIKNGCGQSCDGTLKLTLSEEWTNWVNWFFACWYKSWSKIYWVGMVKNVCGQSGHSKIDCISKLNRWNNLIFACWYKFRKAESWFSHFLVGLVKNGSGFLVHEILKPTVT